MLERLDAAIARGAATEGVHPTRVPRQVLVRYDRPAPCVDMDYELMLCVVTSGGKTPDDGTHAPLAPGDMLLNLVDVPVVASFTPPYRSVTMAIDPLRVAALDADTPRTRIERRTRGSVGLIASASDELLDAVCRWVELLDDPDDVPVLAPRYEDEILYRLLRGPYGPELRNAALVGRSDPIRRVIAHIGEHYADRSLDLDELAGMVGLSATVFFRRFRARTGLTPARYIKRIRLQRARQLLATGETAATASALVGYVSAAHFNRDYSQLYGASPRRHARIGASAYRPAAERSAVGETVANG